MAAIELTEKQMSLLQDHVNQFDPSCSVCGTKDWRPCSQIYLITSALQPGNREFSARAAYLIRCARCAQILMFDLGDLADLAILGEFDNLTVKN